jgi:hypothetical protein
MRSKTLAVALLLAIVCSAYASTLIVRKFDKIVVGQSNLVTTGLVNVKEGTTAASGIYFGSDTNLYRSAADTLKTDDALIAASTLAVTGAQTNTGALTVNGNTTLGDAGTDTVTSVAAVALNGNTTLGDAGTDTVTAAAAVALNGNTTLGDTSADTVTCTGRLILRTLATDPLDGTAGNRPAGSAGEIGIYSGGVYLCTNAATPTWVKVGPAT